MEDTMSGEHDGERDEVAPQDDLGGRRADEDAARERAEDGTPDDAEDPDSASGGDGEAAGTVEEREAVATDDDELFG
jgi:hypothetical protein